jgi:CRISPR-associated endonuclease/helicase Cas3
MSNFSDWFTRVAGVPAPYPWQREVGNASLCVDRLLRVPTGFGKTAGTILPWIFRRVVEQRRDWPTRLVYCLPMRVLAEQTEREIRAWLERAELSVPVNVLMGGVEQTRWVAAPERPQILVGTQDMILSRALMRGYASGRALWPMEYGLIHNDSLWVVDEVQLMDVGLATTAQLRAFRATLPPSERPRATWWMSATLQESWLKTVDHAALMGPEELPRTTIPAALRTGGLWEVRKSLDRRADVGTPDEIAKLVVERHNPTSLTLVVVNTVKRALEVYKCIEKARRKTKAVEADLRVVHSRFRGAERRTWASEFLRRGASMPAAGRIVVATQIVEAGVDISASLLVTDLAPWPSLVQRFGRCARYERETGAVIVVGAVPADQAKSAPYERVTLESADEGLARLAVPSPDASPRSLEEAEERWTAQDPDLVARLYPYAPLHILRRADFLDLFDTSPDLAGADLDVSRYIRTSEDERDVRVFFRVLEAVPHGARSLQDIALPVRDELCPVPIGEIDAHKRDVHVLDFVDDRWRRVDRVVPGMVLLLDAAQGGYDTTTGWDGIAKSPVPVVALAADKQTLAAASGAYERDDLSVAQWKTIATHGRETGEQVLAMASELGLGGRLVILLQLAARWHDAGKAHPVFQSAVAAAARASGPPLARRRDLAKAPSWNRPPYPERRGFRHELASVLALYEVIRRACPDHPAILGEARQLLAALGTAAEEPAESERLPELPLTRELVALSAEEVDLVAWLVATHHGKIRVSWTSTPLDQESGHGGIAGVCDGDEIPPFEVAAADGARVELPSLRISLALAEMGIDARYGASWADRVSRLIDRYGPTNLAWLEALLRAADWRASQLATEDRL